MLLNRNQNHLLLARSNRLILHWTLCRSHRTCQSRCKRCWENVGTDWETQGTLRRRHLESDLHADLQKIQCLFRGLGLQPTDHESGKVCYILAAQPTLL